MNTTELKEQLAASNKNRIEALESATTTLRATVETSRKDLSANAENFSKSLKTECAAAMQRLEGQAAKFQRQIRRMLIGAGVVILLVAILVGSWILKLEQRIPNPPNAYLLTTGGATWAAMKPGTMPVTFNEHQYFQVQPFNQK